MMRVKTLSIYSYWLQGLLLASCIRDQAQNMEADIETATIANSTEVLQVQPIITDNTITFRLREYTTDFHFSREFTLTLGASMKPAKRNKTRLQHSSEIYCNIRRWCMDKGVYSIICY